jgi:hypothetical protein
VGYGIISIHHPFHSIDHSIHLVVIVTCQFFSSLATWGTFLSILSLWLLTLCIRHDDYIVRDSPYSMSIVTNLPQWCIHLMVHTKQHLPGSDHTVRLDRRLGDQHRILHLPLDKLPMQTLAFMGSVIPRI